MSAFPFQAERRKRALYSAFSMLILVTLACSIGPPPTPTPEPTNTPLPPTATPAPTETPEPTQTPEPTHTPEATEPGPTPEPEVAPEQPEAQASASPAAGDFTLPDFTSEDYGWWIYTNGNFVRDLALHEGTLYAATGGGVVAWDTATGESTKHTIYDGLVSNDTNAITACALPTPSIVAGSDSGLSVLDLETGEWTLWTTENQPMSADAVRTLACARTRDETILMLGYDLDGLDLYAVSSGEWLHFGTDDGLDSNVVEHVALTFNADGEVDQLWVASNFALTVLSQGEAVVYDEENGMPDASIQALEIAPDGTAWIGVIDGLIKADREGNFTLYNDATIPNFPFGLIYGVDVAADGTVWIGSSLGEVCQFDPAGETCLVTYEDQPNMAETASVLRVDEAGNVYYGDNEGGGISHLPAGSQTWENYFVANQIPTNQIQAFAEDAEGFVWVATDNGVFRAPPSDLTGSEWELFDRDNSGLPGNFVGALYADPGGGMWFGGFSGAAYFDGSHWTLVDAAAGLPDETVNAFTTDDLGRTWIGTDAGIAIWDGHEVTALTSADGLPADPVEALLHVEGVIWAGTDGSGLVKIDPAVQEISVYDTTTGLEDDRVDALALDTDGTLLLGNGRYLVDFDPAAASATRVPTVEGYYISSINIVAETGEIWVSTMSNYAFYFDGNEWRYVWDGPPAEQIQQIFVDTLGTIWFAGNSYNAGGGGLGRFIPEPEQ